MNAKVVGAAAALLLSTGILFAAPAGRLAPKDIETLFFTGKAFTAATPANVKFKMVFSPDGTMTREPMSKSGAKSEGTWKLSPDGFCSTWKGSKQNCYRVQESGPNKWAIIVSTQAVAYWSK
jgi:hypothetical protein